MCFRRPFRYQYTVHSLHLSILCRIRRKLAKNIKKNERIWGQRRSEEEGTRREDVSEDMRREGGSEEWSWSEEEERGLEWQPIPVPSL